MKENYYIDHTGRQIRLKTEEKNKWH
jgi:hypothetical protein